MEIKICGIKSATEAESVAVLGVDYLGVIFAPSIRQVSVETAYEISSVVHKYAKKCVGVFVVNSDENSAQNGLSESEILRFCQTAKLDVAQIYGEYNQNLRANLAKNGIKVWKVYSVNESLPRLENELFDKALFDYKGLKLGGNGKSFNWEILENLKNQNFVLAGGIGADNALEAVKFSPDVLDINSKVEDENHIKSPEKIKEILEILKNRSKN